MRRGMLNLGAVDFAEILEKQILQPVLTRRDVFSEHIFE